MFGSQSERCFALSKAQSVRDVLQSEMFCKVSEMFYITQCLRCFALSKAPRRAHTHTPLQVGTHMCVHVYPVC